MKNTPFRGVFLFSVENLTPKLQIVFILTNLVYYLMIIKISEIMEDSCSLYRSQRQKAKDVLVTLEKHRDEIYFKLKSNESDPYLHKELRTVNLNIKITLNEIEHAEDKILECDSENKSVLN